METEEEKRWLTRRDKSRVCAYFIGNQESMDEACRFVERMRNEKVIGKEDYVHCLRQLNLAGYKRIGCSIEKAMPELIPTRGVLF